MHNKEIIETTKQLKEIAREIDVLVVEDDEILLKQLYNLLCKFFRRVDIAEHGLQGLNRLSERTYDLVITDLSMPIIDGVSLIENIRQKDCEQSILVLSAHHESEKLLRLIDMKIDGYLLKPIHMDIVLLKLYKICNEVYSKKELEGDRADLALTPYKKERETGEDEKLDESISAAAFAELYPSQILSVNAALKLLEDRLDISLVRYEKNQNYKSVDTFIEILKEYEKHLNSFVEFKRLVSNLGLLIKDLEAIRIDLEMYISSLIILFENLEQLRRGVFESQSAQNIYEYERRFTKIFEQITRDRNETFEIIKGILS